jgi:hypothetical protein
VRRQGCRGLRPGRQQHRRRCEASMDIEQILYEAERLQDAASLH